MTIKRFLVIIVVLTFAVPSLTSVGQASRLSEQQASRLSEQQASRLSEQQGPSQKPAPPPAKSQPPPKPAAKPAPAPVPQAPAVPPPPGYVIGPDDVLHVLFRYDKDLTTEVVVRPDGMISLPILSDVQAAGLTPEQLRDKVTASAKRFIEDPAVTVIVKQINSRRVFITGQVARPGPYALTSPTTVMQLIAMAGGLTDFADEKGISVMRMESGKPVSYAFNYKDVTKRKNLKQNIELKPGDTVIVP